MGHTDQCEKAMRGTAHVAMAHVRKGGHVAGLYKLNPGDP
jgi:abhydrolase domain-containing protein 1/3